jgi:amphi-Trp domain-containing protein
MKKGKKNFQHESIQDAKTIRKILNAISESIEKGKLEFSDEDDTIEFSPNGLMQLKISATQDGNQHRFNIKVSWQSDKDTLKNKTLNIN